MLKLDDVSSCNLSTVSMQVMGRTCDRIILTSLPFGRINRNKVNTASCLHTGKFIHWAKMYVHRIVHLGVIRTMKNERFISKKISYEMSEQTSTKG